MKTKIIFSTLIAVIFSISAVFAQQTKSQQRTNNNLDQKMQSTGVDLQSASAGSYGSDALPGSRGSAYLNPEFNVGAIVYKNGSQVDGKPLRYNLYTQQMQFIEDGDTLALGKPDGIELIRIDDRVFVYTDYLCNGKHKSGYFEMLENGDCRLLKKWSALYHELDGSSNGAESDECFYRDCQCFLQFYMNPASMVQDRKKDFVKSFASNGEEISDYMKAEKLKAKNETDLAKVINYYNTLP